MNEYRISKYDPKYRVDGRYTRNEWSSVADVGRVFSDGPLTEQECCSTIENYCKCAIDILQAVGVGTLILSDLEKYDEHVIWYNDQVLKHKDIVSVVRDCLKEHCWCCLSGQDAFIHFGYELYMYVGCALDTDALEQICAKYHLFSEKRDSPYKGDDI